jgi:hypothetical protein
MTQQALMQQLAVPAYGSSWKFYRSSQRRRAPHQAASHLTWSEHLALHGLTMPSIWLAAVSQWTQLAISTTVCCQSLVEPHPTV